MSNVVQQMQRVVAAEAYQQANVAVCNMAANLEHDEATQDAIRDFIFDHRTDLHEIFCEMDKHGVLNAMPPDPAV